MGTKQETATHTPGPWEAGKAYKHDANTWFAVVFAPAKTGKYHAPRAAEALGIDKDEAAANARLIAAAPDLLEVLQEVRTHCPDLLHKCEWSREIAHPLTGKGKGTLLDLVDAAIAKADGRE